MPTTGLVQLLYDTKRSVLYGLTRTQVKVLNPTTLQWQTPIVPGGTGGSGYVAMTLTPDGTNLLIADSVKDTWTVVNPDNPALRTDIALPSRGSGGGFAGLLRRCFRHSERQIIDSGAPSRVGFPGHHSGKSGSQS